MVDARKPPAPFPAAHHGAGLPSGTRPGRSRPRPVAGPPPSAEHALAARAAELTAALAAPTPPSSWALAGFARDVDIVRRQLGPLHDRGMLVASYERESGRLATLRRLAADPTTPPSPVDPIEAAYALRWLELAPGAAPLPSWSELVGRERRSTG
jgi:hypothetical protein